MEIVETIVVRVDDQQASKAYDGLEESQRDLAKAVRSLEGAIKDSLGGVEREARDADKGVKRLNATILNLDAALGLAEKGVKALQKGFNALRAPIDLATGFEAGVAQIRTLGQDLAADFDEQLLALAKDLPQTAGDLTRATYDAISAGIAPTNVIDFIRSTSNAAVAGGADLTEATGVLTTAVNAFPELAGDASRAADILFATVRAGVTDFRQLAATDVGASLAGFGVRLDEVGALLAEFTKRGMSTSEALTTIQAITKSVVNPVGKAAKVFNDLGVEVGASALRSKGLTAILAEVNEAAGGNVDVIASLTRRQEAMRGLLPLLTGGFEQYAATLDTVRATQGATAESAAIMANTAQGAHARFRSLTEGILTRLGRQVLPAINALLEDLGRWLETNGDEFAKTIADAANALISMGRWAVEHGDDLIRILGSIFVAKKVAEWTGAIQEAIGAVGGLGDVAEEVGPEIAGKLFDPGKMGAAFSAALRSPAFIGLVIGAATFIGAKLRETISDAIKGAIEEGAARVDVTPKVGGFQAQALAETETLLKSAFERGGEERLRDAAAGQVQVLNAAASDIAKGLESLQAQSDKAREAFQTSLASYQEVFRGARKFRTVEDFLAAPAEIQERYPRLATAATEVTKLGEAMANTAGKAQEFASAAASVPDVVSRILTPAATTPASGGDDTGTYKASKDRAAALEREARLALAVAEAYTKAEADLLKFDFETSEKRKEAIAVGADVEAILRARAAERVGLVQAIRDETDSAFADLSRAGDRIKSEVETEEAMNQRRIDGLRRLSAAYADHAQRVTDASYQKQQASLAEAAAYASTAQGAIGSLSAIAEMAGASSAVLATFKIAENVARATEEGAKSIASFAPGPTFNPAAGTAHALAAAQFGAAAIKWGADALGGSGSASGARGSVGAGGARAGYTPQRPSLPAPERTQPTTVNVTINGVVATDRQAARTLGNSMAPGVVEGVRRSLGQRGSFAAVPASAGFRF